MLDTQLVEDPDDDPPDVIPRAVGSWERVQQQIERTLSVTVVKRRESLAEILVIRLALELDPGGEAVSGEAARDSLHERARLVPLATREQHPRERDRGVRTQWLELERLAQRSLLALRDERVGFGGEQRVEESVHCGGGLRAH